MNILALNASFRGSRGQTARLCDLVLEGARSAGAGAERLDLAALSLKPCSDCQVCQKPDHFLRCAIKDDMESLFAAMRRADLLIFATPVYTFAMSSLLKTVLERYYATAEVGKFRLTRRGLFFHDFDAALCGKPFLPLVVCDNVMAETPGNVLHYFRTYAAFTDARPAGRLVRTSAARLTAGGTDAADAACPGQASVLEAFRQAGIELATRGRLSRRTRRLAERDIVGMPGIMRIPAIRRLLAGSPAFRERISQAHGGTMALATAREPR
jgi:putative NADPH-quinone reductase